MDLVKDQLYFLKETSFEDGLEAISTNLSPSLILEAYPRGLFPWHQDHDYFYWFNPDPRMVLFTDKVKVSKSMRNILNRQIFTITINKCFDEVMQNCATVNRKNQDSTWISNAFLSAYQKLHTLGYAHSIEVWHQEKLVGGLYGIKLGKVFFGESMFSKMNNASKRAFIYLSQEFKGISLIDCQVPNPHLSSLGAQEMEKSAFLKLLKQTI